MAGNPAYRPGSPGRSGVPIPEAGGQQMNVNDIFVGPLLRRAQEDHHDLSDYIKVLRTCNLC